MKNIFYKIASYVWDIPLAKTSSPQNEYLEIVWSMGRKMLNTENANFSFGSGYAVFKLAMSRVPAKIGDANSILVLGFGCGSILDLLEKRYNYSGNLDGVEYDQEIINLFHQHFAPDYNLKPNISVCDAKDFSTNSENKYDIIFIDLFIDLETAPLVFDEQFITNLNAMLSPKGCLIFNTILKTTEDNIRTTELMIQLGKKHKSVQSFSFQDLNKIIIAQ
jgi:spermidine synthase